MASEMSFQNVDGRTTAYMLVDPITGVLNDCRHKKGTGLIVKKLLFMEDAGDSRLSIAKSREICC